MQSYRFSIDNIYKIREKTYRLLYNKSPTPLPLPRKEGSDVILWDVRDSWAVGGIV